MERWLSFGVVRAEVVPTLIIEENSGLALAESASNAVADGPLALTEDDFFGTAEKRGLGGDLFHDFSEHLTELNLPTIHQ